MIADRFPIDTIIDLLERNIIANSTMNDMNELVILWKEYVEPDLDAYCGICKERIINNWREIQPSLIFRVKQHKLLDSN